MSHTLYGPRHIKWADRDAFPLARDSGKLEVIDLLPILASRKSDFDFQCVLPWTGLAPFEF